MSPEQIREVVEEIKANDGPVDCRILLRNRKVIVGWFTGVSESGLVAVYRLRDAPEGRPTWVNCQEIVSIEECQPREESNE